MKNNEFVFSVFFKLQEIENLIRPNQQMKETSFIISIGQKLEVLYGSLEAEFKIETKVQAVNEIQVDLLFELLNFVFSIFEYT